MPYSDFSLKRVKDELGVRVVEQQDMFARIDSVEISDLLQQNLAENVPLAIAINTEKARSELIIANFLVELRKLFDHQVSFFSGVEFNVDKEKSLNGFCDFIVSASSEQLMLSAPVVTIVEAKNENIIGGLGQCIAEMVAANIFNVKEHNDEILKVYGVVTTGTVWRFLKLESDVVYIDLSEFYIERPGKILGVLSSMVRQIA